MGVPGLHYNDIANALNGIGVAAGEVDTALNNLGPSIGHAGGGVQSTFQNIVDGIGSIQI